MSFKEFKFTICSPFDFENLVCEIDYRGVTICQISKETDELTLEIYHSETYEWLNAPLEDFQNALEAAKKHYLCE